MSVLSLIAVPAPTHEPRCGASHTKDICESLSSTFIGYIESNSSYPPAAYFWGSLTSPHWLLLPLLCLLESWLVPTGTGGPNHRAPVAFLPKGRQKDHVDTIYGCYLRSLG